MLPTASSDVHLFDEDDSVLGPVDHPTYGGIRLPDGRAFAWSEYGSPRGVPCLLIPDLGSSRLAPTWLLHDSALPTSIRLLALDRPGTGESDPVGLGGRHDPADDLAHLVQTLAVGRIAVIGIGEGVDDAMAFAARHPRMVTGVTAVTVRLSDAPAPRRSLRRPFGDRRVPVSGAVPQWSAALGDGADLTDISSWQRALDRLDERALLALGDRWQEDDFRAAVAADAGESGGDWRGIAGGSPSRSWVDAPALQQLPVRFWHGQSEAPTPLSEVRALVAGRPTWELSAVSAPSALLGCWPQILSTAAAGFRAPTAA
ncbi:hypothetical protein GIS00_17380 [Nakamurella sp. YIM 132087]|uniref:Alpha/beta hydrolase n=1 Tax=Nakamurella alba TaxID=2665158 RepID=A0A7K1FQS3_9ACTN|nr:alpha/beta hydrolase [Nakamurella alba]MTD15709.1 hypothetical protein [Nakamurella alba]